MPSGANSEQHSGASELTFFLDRQIGRYVVASKLRTAGAVVEVHDDHFHQSTPDLVWIPDIAARGWVLISKDQNLRRNPLERAAYQTHRLRGFIVTGKDMSGHELAALLLDCLPQMRRKVARAAGPVLYTISRTGTFTLIK